MNIAVDIGNSCLKWGIFTLGGELCGVLRLPTKGIRPSKRFLCELLRWDMLTNRINVPDNRKVMAVCYPEPLTWWIAKTGQFPWQKWQETIICIRPKDKFKVVTRKQIPLKIDVDAPNKVGIDRLLVAFAATKMYGNSPMLIVDAGSAITVDVVQNRTFCGGAILPGLTAMSETYPKISEKLPLVSVHSITESVYPGKNTEDAIQNGIYWGTIGAIRQFYEMIFPQKDAFLILTGGDASYLEPGLRTFFPHQMECEYHLVLEGIHRCFDK